MGDYIQPDWRCTALLTIDLQRDFTLRGAPAEITGTTNVIPNVQRLVHASRQNNQAVIHVVRIYRSDGSNVDLCRREAIESGKQMVLAGSHGAELVDELKPSPQVKLDDRRLLRGELQSIGSNEWVIYKPRWGAFYQTRLETHLRSLDITTVIICGCNFPNCPRATIYEASERDFRVVFVPDATSGVYERGLEELKGIGVTLLGTDELLAVRSGLVTQRST